MNKNYIINCVLLLMVMLTISTNIYSQDLSEKKQQLEELKTKISEEEKLIENKEKIKSEKQNDLNLTKKKHNETERKINELSKSEKRVKSQLNDTIEQINRTDIKIEDLGLLCELEFNNLFVSHFDKKFGFEQQFDPNIIACFLENTVQEMKTTLGFKDYLVDEKVRKNESYESFAWSLSNSKKQKSKYKKEMNNLQSDLTEIERDRLAALERKQQLEKEATHLDDLITQLQDEIFEDDFSYVFSTDKLKWPVQGKVIKPFGSHRAEHYKVSLKNNGIDIAADEGTPVIVVDDGVVAFAEWYEGAGKMVIVDHKNGFYSLYSHNSLLLVSKGERVFKNQEIALSGKTGSAESACLHFEIRKRGTPVDPMEYLE